MFPQLLLRGFYNEDILNCIFDNVYSCIRFGDKLVCDLHDNQTYYAMFWLDLQLDDCNRNMAHTFATQRSL